MNEDFDKSVKSGDMKWTDEEYIFPLEAFIPYKQDGYAGPITSYYQRVNSLNPFFT